MTRPARWPTWILVLAVAAASVGCSNEVGHEAEYAAERALTAAGHGSYDAKDSEAIGDSTSESHRIMTIMILKGAGMNSDLDSYNTAVELVDLVDSDTGKTIKAVVIDSTSEDPQVVLPQNLDE